MPLSTPDLAEDGFRLQNFRHGEAPWQEREFRTLASLTLEVERNRNETTPPRCSSFQVTNTFSSDLAALVSVSKPDSLHGTCAIDTTFSATAGGKKEVVFLFEHSTVWAMPKPAMTPEDVEALTKALQEMHAAEVDVQKAFLEQRPWEERDKAIKKARQTRYAWISLGAKFFTNWPA